MSISAGVSVVGGRCDYPEGLIASVLGVGMRAALPYLGRRPSHTTGDASMKAQMQKGFTLIELMIVVAIIGILAAIALPAYSNYQAKSKLTAGLAEISAGKTAFEELVNNGEAVADADDIGLQGTTQNCTITATAAAGAGGTIACEITNAPTQVNGATLTWTRTDAGVWTCATAGATDGTLAPKTCPQS